MNVALRQLTEQYAAQPMIRYIVAVTSSCLLIVIYFLSIKFRTSFSALVDYFYCLVFVFLSE